MANLTTYKFPQHYGINDLKILSAYTGSWGQGDHYSSNDVSLNHPSYVSFQFDCEQTQEAVDAEIEYRKRWNKNYTASLKANGKFGQEYFISLSMIPHPLFDEAEAPKMTMSHSFHLLDLSKVADEK